MKKQKKFDPFKNLILNEEELEIERSLERGEYEELPNLEETKLMLREAAKQYQQLHMTKPITIRVNQLDLIKVKAKAQRKQIPYQTLLSAVIHDYAEEKRKLNL